MVSLSVDKKGIQEVKIFPYEQCREEVIVELLEGEKLINFYTNIEELNNIISNEKELVKAWYNYSEMMKYNLLNGFYPYTKLQGYFYKGLKKAFKYKPLRRTTLSQYNYIRNEAHHELLLTVLKNYHRKD